MAKKVAIIMGSDSDLPVVKKAFAELDKLNISYEVHVLSAHRTPELVAEFSKNAKKNGFGVIISAAGKAAHLGGVIAAYTTLPVIGVPIKSSTLDGMDALLATVQMPTGVPVATVAIDGAANAAILAAQMLALSDDTLAAQLEQMKIDMKKLETWIKQTQPELDSKITKLKVKIERNLEYRKRAYEQFMDEVLSKEEYLELKQMYETENQKYQKELSELDHKAQSQQSAVNKTKIWLEHFNRRKITAKQLTREVLVELIDKIYVYPNQKLDIYFMFASMENSADRILEKDRVM